MFTQFKNIDSAFKHIKAFSIALIGANVLICGFIIYSTNQAVSREREHIYILANGKALEAFSADRKDNVPVEARDHIRMFHEYFFSLDPDDKVITENVSKALYLADESAKRQYDNLRENGYFSNLISGNISQEFSPDSIQLDMDQYPYYFRCYGKQKLIRSSSTSFRNLVTEGYLRNVGRSDNNPHGFLISKWRTLDNSARKGEESP
ncbi:MAG: conjugative transposon protein TraK [Chitinophagaceae bacterium]|nr:MAG: conjugative transposon protein TraK [Chitinophagaceae bacterium]